MGADESASEYGLLESRLGYRFVRPDLCEAALTHKSWLNETHEPNRTDNERLEFLGDAVSTLVVSDLLMKRFPDRAEGDLSKIRAAVVSEAGLARAAERAGLGEWIFLGKGEEQANGRRKPSILANALEAMVGAVHLDGGFQAAFAVTARLFAPILDEAEKVARLDYKSRLQERTQALIQATPRYAVVAETGPGHDKTFEVAIYVAGRKYGRAFGKSKKEAEQTAASVALTLLDAENPAP